MPYFQPFTTYGAAEWSSGVVTDYDVSAQAGIFDNCPNPRHIIIRADNTITVKFNKTTMPAVTINANTVFEIDLCIYAMFITVTSAPTAVKIMVEGD